MFIKSFVSILLLSFPEAFIKAFFALSIFQPVFIINYKRLVGYSLLIGIISYTFRSVVSSFELVFLIMLLICIVLLKIFLKINWSLAFSLTLFGYVVQLICEFVILYFVIHLFNTSLEMIQNNILLETFLPYIYLIPLLLFSIYIRKKSKNNYWEKIESSKYKLFWPLITMQLIIGLLIHALYYVSNDNNFKFLIKYPIFTLLMVVVSIIIFIYLNKLHKLEINKSIEYAEKPLTNEMEKLISQWRKYRHDFHNHIEVLFTLLNDNNMVEAKEYISSIHNKVIESQMKLPFIQPTIQALINSKKVQSEEKNILFVVKSEEKMLFPTLKSYDTVILLGNIIDNAIEALQQSNRKGKYIHINYKYILNIDVLEIENNGPEIPSNIKAEIFNLGFTTKGNTKIHGNGLAIVRDIVNQYEGEITVSTDEERTVFQIAIPRNF